MCLPRFDGPSIFGAMLDRDAGGFRVGPADQYVPAGRRYLPGTKVLETTWGTRTGWVIVRDVLLIGPWHHEDERSHSHRRSPTDYDADHVLLRMLRCVNGSVEINVDCEPMLDYGRTPVQWEYSDDGYHKAIGTAPNSETKLQLDDRPAPRLRGRRVPAPARRCATATSPTSRCRGPSTARRETYDEAYRWLVRTADYWHEWLAHGDFPDHPWRTYLQRSALTLKGLTYAPTGAMIAAATTSLPETPGGERNWDYRYTLDPRLHVHALGAVHARLRLGGQRLLLLHPRRRDGRRRPPDHVRDRRRARPRRGRARPPRRLRGRPPVRIGNGAYNQEQHDVWGALLDSIYLHTKSRDELPEEVWPILKHQVESAIANWREPDRGIWEIRGDPMHFTSSKVMCWVACDRGARLARLRGRRRARRALAGRQPTRSTPTSARTASTSAACSASTTTPTRSTRRCC